MQKPLCFVLMPFGRKLADNGAVIDFDAVYGELVKPGIESAGLTPLRGREGPAGGIVDKPMFERLILCEYAVADLTTSDANVLYALGVRQAVKPATTLLTFVDGTRLLFGLARMPMLAYRLDLNGKPAAAEEDQAKLARLLEATRAGTVDSPVYQLLEGFPDIQHLKTDVFRERVEYSAAIKDDLRAARSHGHAAIRDVEQHIGPFEHVEAGALIDLLLSYRAVSAWDEMIRVADKMSDPLRRTPLVREQLAFALNRAGHREEAERVLLQLIDTRGPSSETCSLLGRVYKDLWEAALKKGDGLLAGNLLDKAIHAYLKGFETDWRDAYPGINAVTLMTLRSPPDGTVERLLPVLRYAVERRIVSGKPDYWDYATLVELAVLAKDQNGAADALAKARSLIRERWEPETTARNLRLIREAREARNEVLRWTKEIEEELTREI
jgi:tetratricopeptide (TPR) repeat protein